MGGRSGDTELAGIHTYREAREARERKAGFHGHLVRVTFPGAHCLPHSRPPMHLRTCAGRKRFRGGKQPPGLFQAILQNSSAASRGQQDTGRKLRSHGFPCVLARLSAMLSGGGGQ